MNRFASFSVIEMDMLKKSLFSLRHVNLHVASKEVVNSPRFLELVLQADFAEAMVDEINQDPRVNVARKPKEVAGG